ncbi:MAG: alpha/beta hydrolase family protein [Gemmatimonadaceae bacterium]
MIGHGGFCLLFALALGSGGDGLSPRRTTGATSHPGDGRTSPLPIDPCSSGTFVFMLAGARVGQERFEVKCQPDGAIVGTGRTVLNLPGVTSDLETVVELGSNLLPKRVRAKGTSGTTAVDQLLEIGTSGATMTSNGVAQQITIPAGASYLGSNVYYALPFLVARYDTVKGGDQSIPAFPGGSVMVNRAGRDSVPIRGRRTPFQRYTLQLGPQRAVLWFDASGHIAVVAVPSQRFAAIREDMTTAGDALVAILEADIARYRPVTASDYAPPAGASFRAEEVTVPAGRFALGGTLLIPGRGKSPFPAVVMITGSGQQDRDEALALPGLEKFRPFRQIAEALAARGIAVLRVDDRGVGRSGGSALDDDATTSGYANDTRAQVAWLRARPDIDGDRIALIGHSEGAIIAPLVAVSDPRIAAIVLLAGTAKPGISVSGEQYGYMLSVDSSTTAEQRAKLLADQRAALEGMLSATTAKGKPGVAWMKEFLTYDPGPTIRQVKQPILVLQGAKDRQVLADHATRLAQGAREGSNRDVTLRVFPDLNHLFLPALTGAFAEYSHLSVTSLGDDVLGAIGDWLAPRLRVDR